MSDPKSLLMWIIWAAGPASWVFYSGVVSGLGANLFATRFLAPSQQTNLARAWLEFGVFVGSAAFGMGAGEFRRRAEDAWRAGGARPGHREGFLISQLPGLLSCAAVAIYLVLTGFFLLSHRGA